MTTALPLPHPRAAATGRWAVRALVALAVVASAVLGAGAANATFSDSVALPAMTVGTGTVAPATDVTVETTCRTTTTVVKRTYRVSPGTGATTLIAYSLTSSTVTSTSNVESDETTTTWSKPTEYTTTQTVQDTELYATLRWQPSTSTRVTGYRMTAHTTYGPYPMGETGPTTTRMSARYDADVVDYGAQLSIDTLTDYGWTATSDLSNVVTC
ncbi:hypothetical protein E4P41_01485 [Geodermatophilus sp. DF01-2]|uniref:hypothetical protein n=1 Tax=Geodermatophilus sp. DF01-2 TaxID=2559610 RepID=UPI0010731A32|nr:hypothetical protein [Geodermatophilus sp. DF01_2]TFV64566.1 hypothetical protein E4P41_01485 [Geodermatophilus sp. DF01_2]